MILPFRTDAEAEAALPQVAAHLGHGGLLGYPTETVYGLGSMAVAKDLEALAALKGRPPKKPFLLLVASRPMAEASGLVFSAAARVLADEFWPGPLWCRFRRRRSTWGRPAFRRSAWCRVARDSRLDAPKLRTEPSAIDESVTQSTAVRQSPARLRPYNRCCPTA